MTIVKQDRQMIFNEGEEALSFLPILLGVLRVNNKNKPVRMAHKDGKLLVTCYAMTDQEWESSLNDIYAWNELLKIWKETS